VADRGVSPGCACSELKRRAATRVAVGGACAHLGAQRGPTVSQVENGAPPRPCPFFCAVGLVFEVGVVRHARRLVAHPAALGSSRAKRRAVARVAVGRWCACAPRGDAATRPRPSSGRKCAPPVLVCAASVFSVSLALVGSSVAFGGSCPTRLRLQLAVKTTPSRAWPSAVRVRCTALPVGQMEVLPAPVRVVVVA